MNATAGATRAVAEFVAGTSLADVPAAAVAGAKLCLLDTLGVALAALQAPQGQTLVDYVRGQGGTAVASVIGGGFKTSAPQAALANGCLANLLDFDGFWHVPTCSAPAALAVAEARGASGGAALEALIIGTEVGAAFRHIFEGKRGEQAGPTYQGWYHLSFHGPLAAAAAASRLLGLSVAQTEAALSITMTGAGGVRNHLHTAAKSLLSGNAAANGVQAALLAAAGVTATDTLEGFGGLFHAIGLPDPADWAPVTQDLGHRYSLAGFNASKGFPAHGGVQAALGTLRALLAEHGLSRDAVRQLDAEVSTFAASAELPATAFTGGFSWPYLLGVCLAAGSFDAAHLTQAAMDDPALRAGIAKVHILPIAEGAQPERLTLHLHDGRTVSAEVRRDAGRATGPDGLLAKYRATAATALPLASVEALHDLVMGLEDVEGIGAVTDVLRDAEVR